MLRSGVRRDAEVHRLQVITRCADSFSESIMDETAKIIIATLSGFVIAFLAEPVKLYFQNKQKIRQMRTILYREIASNYKRLHIIVSAYDDLDRYNDDYEYSKLILKRLGEDLAGFHFDCYQLARKDLTVFYQMEEAITIDSLYTGFQSIRDNEENRSKEYIKYQIWSADLIILNRDKRLKTKLLLKLDPDIRMLADRNAEKIREREQQIKGIFSKKGRSKTTR
jgi:hypothetical protein